MAHASNSLFSLRPSFPKDYAPNGLHSTLPIAPDLDFEGGFGNISSLTFTFVESQLTVVLTVFMFLGCYCGC